MARKGKTTHTAALPVADLSQMLKPYPSGWVALSSDERRVVAAGATLEETKNQAKERGLSDALFVKVIPPDQGYIPLYQ
jgi:hypothetical protein